MRGAMQHELRARPATPADAEAIAQIYNQGIADRVATFEVEPRTAADIERWFDGGPEQAILGLVALTDGLASRRQLEWLARHPRLSRVTGSLDGLSSGGWDWALRVLHDCGLVKVRDDGHVSIPRLVQESVLRTLLHRAPQARDVSCPADEDLS